MTYSITVMAHTSRLDHAHRLATQLDAMVSLDDGSLGENANGDRAWSMCNPLRDWAVVIQDDAMPYRHFTRHLDSVLNRATADVVGLYVGTSQPRPLLVTRAVQQAEHHKAGWITASHMYWGVGIAIRTQLVPDMLEHVHGDPRPYDARIGAWARDTRRTIAYCWPSILDHADGPSLVHFRSKPRRAHKVAAPYPNRKTVEL